MNNIWNNNFLDREEFNKKLRNEFADEIVEKISETGVDFKKFLQAVFDEKILTDRQEEILKLLYGVEDGIVKNANQVSQILWTVSNNIMMIRWYAFENILQSEIYKDLFPEENEENFSFADDVVKQKREEILQNLNDDLDNYEYHIDDLMDLENQDILHEDNFTEMETVEIIDKIFKEENLKKIKLNGKRGEILNAMYKSDVDEEQTYAQIAREMGVYRTLVRAYHASGLRKIRNSPVIQELLRDMKK